MLIAGNDAETLLHVVFYFRLLKSSGTTQLIVATHSDHDACITAVQGEASLSIDISSRSTPTGIDISRQLYR